MENRTDILMNMDGQKVSLLVLLDLRSTFDTVNHQVLLERRRSRFGVTRTALHWFASYLSGRVQRISVNGGTSDAFYLNQHVQSIQVSYLTSLKNTSPVCDAMQMTHSCILHLVLTKKEVMPLLLKL